MRTLPLLLAGLVAALFTAAAPAAAVTFAPAAGATVAATTSGLAVGDVDGDRIPDAVVADPDAGTVVLLRGDGAGGFQPAVSVPTAGAPRDVRVGDTQRDGFLDVFYRTDDGVGLLLGSGGGALSEVGGSPWPTGSPTDRGFAIGDLDRDRRLDVTVATAAGVRTMLGAAPNTGTAALSAGPLLTGLPGALGLDLADLDGDGALDLLATSPSSFGLFEGEGSGAFTASATSSYGLFSQVPAVASGDADGDGLTDAVVADGDGGQLLAFLNGGAGLAETVFGEASGGSPQRASLVLADFDRDGRLDAAVPSETRTALRVRRGDGSGRFGDWPEIALGAAAITVVSADADRDGAPDLLALAGRRVHVLVNELASAVTVDGGPLAFADQQRGTVSALQQVTVRSTGGQPLRIDDATVTGAAAGDFWIANDRCSGRTVAVGEACTIGVRFAPTATGARAAQLTLATDAPAAAAAVPLSGVGFPGDAGPQGPAGDDGRDGTDGAPGREGADGADGASGRDGAPGRDGAAGRDGVDGKDGANGRDGAAGGDGTSGRDGRAAPRAAKPACARAGARALRCAAPVRGALARHRGALTVRLLRGKSVVASARVRAKAGTVTVTLRARTTLPKGSYRLTIAAGRTTTRAWVTVR